MATKTYRLFDNMVLNAIPVGLFSYAIALGYLLYTACPLIFAIFVAIPLALSVGVSIVLFAGIYLLWAGICDWIKYEIKFHKKMKQTNQQIDPKTY